MSKQFGTALDTLPLCAFRRTESVAEEAFLTLGTQLLQNPDYTQNPAKIYGFGNCKATATANKRGKLVLTPDCNN